MAYRQRIRTGSTTVSGQGNELELTEDESSIGGGANDPIDIVATLLKVAAGC